MKENMKRIWEQEKHFRALFDQSPIGIILLSPERIILVANPAFCNMLGYSKEELESKHILDVTHPDDLNLSNKYIERLDKRESVSIKIEKRYVRKDGGTVWGQVFSTPFLDGEWDRPHYLAMVEDITDRKKAEEAQSLSVRILTLLSQNPWASDSIKKLTLMMKDFTEFDTVGIRLGEEGKFIYAEYSGFPSQFVENGNFLCNRSSTNKDIIKPNSDSSLGCICRSIIKGEIDHSNPLFSKGGSFWCNNTTKLLATPEETERQCLVRNLCIMKGYESVALIPLRSDTKILGLIQLNDIRADRFTPEMIEMFEGIGITIGVALERWQLGQKILRAKNEWETTFDALPDYIAILDCDFKITRANLPMMKLTGIESGDLGSIHCYEAVHKTDQPPTTCPHYSVFTDAVQHTIEAYEPRFDKYFEITVVPVFEEEKIVRCVHIMVDITDRKKSEILIKQSRDEFQSIFESSPDIVYLNDMEGYFTKINRKFTSVLGYTMDEVIGKTMFWDNLLLEDKDEFEKLNWALEDKKYHLEGYPTTFVTKDKKITSVALSTELISIEGETQLLTIARDITHFLMLEEQLHHASKMEAIGSLAGGVAHDFNNALTPILNAISTLLEDRQPGDVYTQEDIEFLKEADSAAKHSTKIARELLHLSRRQAFKMRPTDINQLMIKMSITALQYITTEISIETNLDPTVPEFIIADENQLEPALLNLIINARDAIHGRGKIILSTSVKTVTEEYTEKYSYAREGKFVVLKITDTGIGMPKKVLAKIFDPFYTTKPMGKGTGLGLTRVFNTLQGHRGWINVYSEVGKGTSVKLYLPIEKPTGEESIEEHLSEETPRGTERILVVDDFPSIINTAKKILQRLGYSVTTCNDGEEALELIKNESFDLIISDLVMPRMGGKKLLKNMRLRGIHIPTLIMSGYPEMVVRGDTPQEAFDGFIEKPFQLDQIGLAIRKVLDKNKIHG
jgi:two-component system, cell cycle sensor histidine kinase and response regulator CckA